MAKHSATDPRYDAIFNAIRVQALPEMRRRGYMFMCIAGDKAPIITGGLLPPALVFSHENGTIYVEIGRLRPAKWADPVIHIDLSGLVCILNGDDSPIENDLVHCITSAVARVIPFTPAPYCNAWRLRAGLPLSTGPKSCEFCPHRQEHCPFAGCDGKEIRTFSLLGSKQGRPVSALETICREEREREGLPPYVDGDNCLDCLAFLACERRQSKERGKSR